MNTERNNLRIIPGEEELSDIAAPDDDGFDVDAIAEQLNS
jgi:hypothetical protein